MSLANLPEIQRLSREEKILLVEELWDEIAKSGDDLPVSADEKAILERRLADHRQSPTTAISQAELKKRLRKRL